MRPATKLATFDLALRRASLANIAQAIEGEAMAYASPEGERAQNHSRRVKEAAEAVKALQVECRLGLYALDKALRKKS